ncbi:MAG TPA: multicopper oxidase domain-containing protein [Candidatus Bathyarchaeia archaeon]|nr:multicopper oxidase domain-containing protein [Candidatus Bathyarchaeia archaeon]
MNRTVAGFMTALVIVAFAAETAFAGETVFNLSAGVTTVTMPGGEVITMWGYALDNGPVSVPGPALVVPPGDSLRIDFTNNLPGAEPDSIMIPGLPMPTDGVSAVPQAMRNPDGRVRSFVHETSVGETASYVWPVIKPGSYVYQSATHPAVHVQMGLYGALTNDAGSGEAYSGVPYDQAVTLVYSEIDPLLHAAVRDGTYGTPAYPSTINYVPQYFLINGQPFTSPTETFPSVVAGQRVLLRFLNAGLKTRVPTLMGTMVSVVAEDGNLYPYPKEHYALLMPAGKTLDAVLVPASEGRTAIFDHTMGLVNATTSGGGMLTYIDVNASAK